MYLNIQYKLIKSQKKVTLIIFHALFIWLHVFLAINWQSAML